MSDAPLDRGPSQSCRCNRLIQPCQLSTASGWAITLGGTELNVRPILQAIFQLVILNGMRILLLISKWLLAGKIFPNHSWFDCSNCNERRFWIGCVFNSIDILKTTASFSNYLSTLAHRNNNIPINFSDKRKIKKNYYSKNMKYPKQPLVREDSSACTVTRSRGRELSIAPQCPHSPNWGYTLYTYIIRNGTIVTLALLHRFDPITATSYPYTHPLRTRRGTTQLSFSNPGHNSST